MVWVVGSNIKFVFVNLNKSYGKFMIGVGGSGNGLGVGSGVLGSVGWVVWNFLYGGMLLFLCFGVVILV